MQLSVRNALRPFRNAVHSILHKGIYAQGFLGSTASCLSVDKQCTLPTSNLPPCRGTLWPR